MYCEKDGQCPICFEDMEFDSMTYNDEYEVQKCTGCKAMVVLNSYTTPTVSGFYTKQGELAVDLEGLFDYIFDYCSSHDCLKILGYVITHEPTLIPDILAKLKEIECLNKV